MSALFASTLFLSALLLFWVEPMMARMVLPLLGGTPAVWNTCVLFFQVLLLAGYAYAYVLDTRLTAAKQAAVHLLILGLAILTLPIGVAQSALRFLPVNANPVFWLLGCLLLSAGLPFLALSANAPLLQRWFSRTGRGEARDPYFLYAASNLGSLCALLAYPLLVEPQLGLIEQSRFWKTGFGLLIGFIVGCGVAVQRSGPAAVALNYAPHREHPSIPGQQRGRWLLLAFAPSSLMLGVTTYLATDIASIPLLWVLPLAIYLWTFILAFASRELLPSRWVLRAVPIGAIALVYMLLSEATRPAWLLIALHLLVFFLASLACHQQLAASRPPTHHLTEFYVWVAIGGALGGFFNALLAPLLFTAVAEYPIALLTACLLRPAQDKRSHWPADAVFAAGLAGLTLLLSVTVSNWDTLSISMRLGISLGVPLLACFLAVDRPFRFAAGLGAVLVVAYLCGGIHGKALQSERNFFGVLRVTRDPSGQFYRLVHGNTIHGRQWVDASKRGQPLSYYHPAGPLGQVFGVAREYAGARNIGVVGLGAGAMAAYARPDETWTFYEINPAILRLAHDTNYFGYLDACQARQYKVVLGDARLRLNNAPSGQYSLLVLDAFSSDAIPMHLITREALRLYLSKLAPGGLIAFHISNRCLELEGVLGDLASDAGLVCHAQDENGVTPAELADGKDDSHWLVMARCREDLGRLNRDSRWLPIPKRPHPKVWTDDFSNILSVFKWD